MTLQNSPGFKISVFADGADLGEIQKRYREGFVRGFTTNPTLMAKAGIKDYRAFAQKVLGEVSDLPFSFEVFSDDFEEMYRQGLEINSWARNVNVKIPITNTKGHPSLVLIRRLLDQGIKLNVTAICTQEQITALREILQPQDDVIVSIFAGRIADTGVDPIPMMTKAVADYKHLRGSKILWASPREVLNIYQAEQCGVHIITVTDALLSKIPLRNKSLSEYSVETVKMFYDDAAKSGFSI